MGMIGAPVGPDVRGIFSHAFLAGSSRRDRDPEDGGPGAGQILSARVKA
jgi:hypothetical protein